MDRTSDCSSVICYAISKYRNFTPSYPYIHPNLKSVKLLPNGEKHGNKYRRTERTKTLIFYSLGYFLKAWVK